MFQSFLEYSKYILERVSFDKNLFVKEYRKALRFLKEYEVEELNSWIRNKGLQLQALPIKT